MRILLDACIPIDFRFDLAAVGTVETAQYAKLSHLSNGALLTAMVGRFDVLITVDGSLQFQQTIAGRPVAVIVLTAASNAIVHLQPFVSRIEAVMTTIKPGVVIEL
jgi:predicted nuclease of predicted toxin-antitoxin system